MGGLSIYIYILYILYIIYYTYILYIHTAFYTRNAVFSYHLDTTAIVIDLCEGRFFMSWHTVGWTLFHVMASWQDIMTSNPDTSCMKIHPSHHPAVTHRPVTTDPSCVEFQEFRIEISRISRISH